MAKVKLYDWNGTLADQRGWLEWFRENHPTLSKAYYESGAEGRAASKDEATAIYRQAEEEGLYRLHAMPGAVERLRADSEEGYIRAIFTAAKEDQMRERMKETGLEDHVDELVFTDDVVTRFGLEGISKEDPLMMVSAVIYMTEQGLAVPETYVDDDQIRLQAAVKANPLLEEQGMHKVGKFYLFDPKDKQNDGEGYIRIHKLQLVV